MMLLIDTSGETALLMLADNGKIRAAAQNPVAKDHSAWLHPAIAQLFQQTGTGIANLTAVGVTDGPGSYTGLRVAMAAAKGICYTAGIPLVTCGTLPVLATAMISGSEEKDAWFCPLIDARRQEVFTALYSADMHQLQPAHPQILDKTSFERELAGKVVVFGGSGAVKWQELSTSRNARFLLQPDVKESFASLAQARFLAAEFADTVYSEPGYGKDFHTHIEN